MCTEIHVNIHTIDMYAHKHTVTQSSTHIYIYTPHLYMPPCTHLYIHTLHLQRHMIPHMCTVTYTHDTCINSYAFILASSMGSSHGGEWYPWALGACPAHCLTVAQSILSPCRQGNQVPVCPSILQGAAPPGRPF